MSEKIIDTAAQTAAPKTAKKKPAAPKKVADTGGFCVYLGPTMMGVIQRGTSYRGGRKEVLDSLAPVIEQIAEQYDGRVKVAKVDIDAHPELAARYGVQSIPTVLVFKNGEMVAREVGARPLGTFTGILDGQLK